MVTAIGRRFAGIVCAIVCTFAWGCGSEDGEGDLTQDVVPAPPGSMPPLAGQVTQDGMNPVPMPPAAGSGGNAGQAPQPGTAGGAAGGDPGAEPAQMPAAGDGAMTPVVMEPANPGSSAPKPPAGPEDGDPNTPVVAIPDVPCGGPRAAFGTGSANFQLGGRDMIVSYPCDKHEGAPMTFILNLHGTTPLELHFYQHGYFSAHRFIDSHNLIVVTPSSVVQQWGNGDNGEDEPHLMAIIDWVYSSFSKFDIRGMWVGGHSWGGGYTARFGCKPELADKVVGLILMSGGGVGGFGGAACADRVSVIISTAEGDGRMPSDQSTVAAGHGCGSAQMEVIANINDHTFWPDCEPGFVHANYYMREKEHATSMDVEVVESIVDWIKLGRQ